ncbi:peptidoglycan-binding domain-containing protein [Aerosakkonema funiforme]|nr:peptidoglycan-binding protein [Aerosakkonema funiforme]
MTQEQWSMTRLKMSGLIRFCLFLLPVSLLSWYQLPPAFSQGFSRLDSEVSSRQSVVRPTLKSGSQGVVVSELQAVLKLLGYYSGAVDGNYDETTAIAVSQFQRAAGIKADGIVGTATWEQLFPPARSTQPSSVSSPTAESQEKPVPANQSAANTSASTLTESPTNNLPILRLGMRGPAVFWLQKRLQATGFFTGAVDGVFGSDTQIAVKAAQRNYGLNADGVVGQSTWRAILP